MILVTLSLSQLNIPAFIEACRRIIIAMTGNANFTTPSPALLSITTALNTLETTYQQGLAGNHSSKALQKSQRKAANALMQQLKTYVQTTSTTPEIAVTSGMALRKTATPHNELAAP